MKLLYKPFSIVAGILGARAGNQMFEAIWGNLSDSPSPTFKDSDASLGKIVVAATIRGAAVAGSVAFTHQMTLRLFRHLFGVWPERTKQDESVNA